jgi:hypothetical protein
MTNHPFLRVGCHSCQGPRRGCHHGRHRGCHRQCHSQPPQQGAVTALLAPHPLLLYPEPPGQWWLRNQVVSPLV